MNDQPLLPLRDTVAQIVSFLPALLGGLLVLLVGALAAWVTAKLLVRLLVLLRVDRVLERLRWGKTLARGDVRHALFGLVGGVAGTLVFLIFLDNAFVIWRLTLLSRLLEKLVLLVPDLVIAGLIVLAGYLVSAVVARSVQRALNQEDVTRAGLIARVTRAAILVFAVAVALLHLDTAAARLVSQAFVITFGALALAFVLAVGLGSRRAVEAIWEDILGRRREADAEPPTGAGPRGKSR